VISDLSRSSPIVLVEDNPDDAFFVGAALKTANIANALVTFESAADARTALATPRERIAPVLFILDLELPGGETGLDLLRWVRRQGEPLASTPAMMLTGAGPDARVESRELGTHFYLDKPVSAPTLAHAVQALGFVVVTDSSRGGMQRTIERR